MKNKARKDAGQTITSQNEYLFDPSNIVVGKEKVIKVLYSVNNKIKRGTKHDDKK